MNLCTSTLPGFAFSQVIDIATRSGCSGVELRVADTCHKSLYDLTIGGPKVARVIADAGLRLAVLNSYIPIEDESAVDALIDAAAALGVPQVRVVLPRAAHAAVAVQANIREGIPSYYSCLKPHELIDRLKHSLSRLEAKARESGVKALLELHWGTVMSSFSSAYLLVCDLDTRHVGITFDPANMVVEGKEDWEYGLALIGDYIANVHVKNVVWKQTENGWTWEWAAIDTGMLDWPYLIFLLKQAGYQGDYAIEDFLAPCDCEERAVSYIQNARKTLEQMFEHNKYFDVGRYNASADILATL